jgi:CheY-like chemotaxis protein
VKPVRVLVADDNEDHRFFIQRALKGVQGVELEVDTVVDGEEALDYLEQRGRFVGQPRPHMVLLDLRMPRRNGLEVLEVVKQDPDLRKIPICVLTSSDRPEDVEEAYLRGTNSYVIKSSDIEGIRRELQTVSEYWTATAALPEPP